MANLIITVITIALVAVASLMGAYYGGTALRKGDDKAKSNAIYNQGSQIQTAVQFHEMRNRSWSNPVEISDLLTGPDASLMGIPSIEEIQWKLDKSGNIFNANLTAPFVTTEICAELAKHVGVIDGSFSWCCNEDASQCNTRNVEFKFSIYKT